MKKRYFFLSACSLAVSAICYAEPQGDTPQPPFDSLDLQQGPQSAFHYTHADMPLALLPGAMVFSRGSESEQVDFFSRGASAGTAITQDRVLSAPAPYSAPQLTLQAPLALQKSMRFTPVGDLSRGGQGAFGELAYESIAIRDTAQWVDFNGEMATDAQYDLTMNTGVNRQENAMLLAGHFSQADSQADLRGGQTPENQQADILFKVHANSLPGARNPQRTEFSYQYTQDESAESLIGLTQADWDAAPSLRYSPTANDSVELSGHKFQLAHEVVSQGASKVLTDFYYQTFTQEGRQLSSLNDELIQGGLATTDPLTQVSLFDAHPSAMGETVGLLGQDNEYESFGVQSLAHTRYGEHQVTYSARYHHDKAEISLMDEGYSWLNDRSLLADTSSALVAYQDSATALTTGVETRFHWGMMDVDLGVVYENVSVERELKDNTAGLGAADFHDTDFSDSEWMPSLGVTFGDANWDLTVGARKLWTAATAGNESQAAQSAWQYEIASHYRRDGMTAQLSLYAQEFDNMHVNCTQGMNCDLVSRVTQTNVEDVSVKGVEFSMAYEFNWGEVVIPLSWSYQYNQSEFKQTDCGVGARICAVNGESLPWIPEQQLAFNTGIVWDTLSVYANAVFQSERSFMVSEQRNTYMPSQVRVDIASNYQINEHHSVYLRIENVLDEELVARETQSGNVTDVGQIVYFGYQWRL